MNTNNIIQESTRVNRKYEILYYPKVRAAIQVQVKRVIVDAKSKGVEHAIAQLSQTIGNPWLAAVVRDLYKTVGSRHARMTYSRLLHDIRNNPGSKSYSGPVDQKGFGFNAQWTKWVLDYLERFLLEKITFDVSVTTRDALMRTLTASVIGGWGVDKTISMLEDWPFERFQAARIVRTEVGRASNVGATAQVETSEYEQQKTWLSVQDNRTRRPPRDHANHVALNGTKIDSGDEFVDPTNGDRLKFPGDPKASAKSVINCRCVVAYELKRDINGEPVPKRRSTSVIYPGQINTGQMITV